MAFRLAFCTRDIINWMVLNTLALVFQHQFFNFSMCNITSYNQVPFNFNRVLLDIVTVFKDISHGLIQSISDALALHGVSGNNRAGFTSNCSTKFRL
jgi:hypothetical protein